MTKLPHQLERGWSEARLSELCDSVDYGYTAAASTLAAGPRFLRITDIVGEVIDWERVPFCEASPKEREKFRLRHGDIVVARTGATTGYSAYITDPPEAVFASYLIRLKVSPDAHPRFVYYFLKSPSFWRYMHGVLGDKSAQPNASATTITQARVPLPGSVREQGAIAETLGALDDKIALNHRMNQTLEAMARAIFKSWFVDFEQTPGAWGEGSLENLASLYKEPLDPSSFPEEEFDHYSIPAFDAGQSPIRESGRQIKSTKLVLPQRAILLSKLNPRISRVWRPDLSRERRSISSTEFLVVVPKKHECDLDYIYSLFSSEPFIETFASRATGTSGSHQRVRLNDLLSIRCVLPEPGLRRLYSQRVKPLFDRIALNREESRTLAALRDTLLPKLLSGELRLKQAEKIVGEAV